MAKLFHNTNLRTKIIVDILGISVLTILGITIYIHLLYREELEKKNIEQLQSTSGRVAEEIVNQLEEHLSSINFFSNVFSNLASTGTADRNLIGSMLKDEFNKASYSESLWIIWDSNAFDGRDDEYIEDITTAYSNESGRLAFQFHRLNNEISLTPISENDASQDFYQVSKRFRKSIILAPQVYSYAGVASKENTFLMESPIMFHNRYLGTIGINLFVNPVRKILHSINDYPNISGQVVSPEGVIIPLDRNNTLQSDSSQTSKISIGFEKQQVSRILINNEDYYSVMTPLRIKGIDNHWALWVTVPQKDLLAGTSRIIRMSSVMFFIGIALLFICVIILVNRIINPISKADNVLKQLSLGYISKTEQLPVKNNDEIGKISGSINSLTSGLREMLDFAEDIGNQKYSTEYHLLSDHDELGHKMIEMRDNLSMSAEKEVEFKKEEERRSWVNHGLANFSEILRNNSHDIESLSYQMISQLVKYLDANQGGLFIVNDNSPGHLYLELSASYAYERRKYQKKTIEVGEGLVGTCYQEGETIYMDDIPDGYTSITSGLGKSTPRYLIIIPMKVNDIIYGIMEIASFHKIESYQIDFLEKIGTNTASTISTVKANLHTNFLLEQSQMQAHRLSEQEEEMRQNMEEMQATQEEMSRKNEESEKAQQDLSRTLAEMQKIQDSLENEKLEVDAVMNAVDNVFMRITYDKDMTLLDINDSCLAFHGNTREKMIGIRLTDKMNPKDISAFEANWAKVLEGKTFRGDGVRKTRDGDKHVEYMYCPIKDKSGKVQKVLMLGRFLEDI